MYVEHEIGIFSIYSTSILPFYVVINSVPYTTFRSRRQLVLLGIFNFEKTGKQVGQQNNSVVFGEMLKINVISSFSTHARPRN